MKQSLPHYEHQWKSYFQGTKLYPYCSMMWTVADSKELYLAGLEEIFSIDDDGLLKLISEDRITKIQEIIEMYQDSGSFRLFVEGILKENIKQFLEVANHLDHNLLQFYPIKANRTPHIMEMITEEGLFLEVGTKEELDYLMQTRVSSSKLMINGIKTLEYVSLLNGISPNTSLLVSVDSISEIELLDEHMTREFSILLRLRIPYTPYSSKFGFTIPELDELANNSNILHKVDGIHVHPSRSKDFDVQNSQLVGYVLKYLIFLEQQEVSLQYINFGGGLSRETSLTNIQVIKAYFRSLAPILDDVDENVTIVTEHGSFFVENCIFIMAKILRRTKKPILDNIPDLPLNSDEEIHDAVQDLKLMIHGIDPENHIETQKIAIRKAIYNRFMGKIRTFLHQYPVIYDPGRQLILDMSIFSNMIDAKLQDKLFPVIPISHLHQAPEEIVTLGDITCDVDGRYALFRSGEGSFRRTDSYYPVVMRTKEYLPGIPLPYSVVNTAEYLLIANVGAYQSTLEADHNLLPPLPLVSVVFKDDLVVLNKLS